MEVEKKKKKQGKKWVVLVPWPFQGHITPTLQLGSVLHSRGFSIIIAHTKFNSPNSSYHPHFLFLPIPDGLSEDDPLIATPFSLISALTTNCKAPFEKILARIIKKQKSSEAAAAMEIISCIISDARMEFAHDVANKLNIQSIVVKTTNPSTVVAYSHIPWLHKKGVIPVQDSAIEEPVPELHPLRFKDLPISKFVAIQDLIDLLHSIARRKAPSAIIWNTMDYLEHQSLAWLQQHCQCPFFPIGPLHKFAAMSSSSSSSTSLMKEDRSCISWLDKQETNSVIYVSLGSIASVDDEDALAEMAWGLANSNQPFLWVLRPGTVRGSTKWIELVPEGFIEGIGGRGCIVKWAPQKEVLAHEAVGAFWSHCGWNSTLESICEGVPMICWPNFGDQKVNARYLSFVWGIAIELEHDAGRFEIERAVRRLLIEDEGKEIRRRAIEYKEKAETSMRKGGFSFESLNALVEHIMSF